MKTNDKEKKKPQVRCISYALKVPFSAWGIQITFSQNKFWYRFGTCSYLSCFQNWPPKTSEISEYWVRPRKTEKSVSCPTTLQGKGWPRKSKCPSLTSDVASNPQRVRFHHSMILSVPKKKAACTKCAKQCGNAAISPPNTASTSRQSNVAIIGQREKWLCKPNSNEVHTVIGCEHVILTQILMRLLWSTRGGTMVYLFFWQNGYI